MFENKEIKAYWEQFKLVSGIRYDQFREARAFSDTDEMADDLANLVNLGTKTAIISELDFY